jgi:hypothetical protein
MVNQILKDFRGFNFRGGFLNRQINFFFRKKARHRLENLDLFLEVHGL